MTTYDRMKRAVELQRLIPLQLALSEAEQVVRLIEAVGYGLGVMDDPDNIQHARYCALRMEQDSRPCSCHLDDIRKAHAALVKR